MEGAALTSVKAEPRNHTSCSDVVGSLSDTRQSERKSPSQSRYRYDRGQVRRAGVSLCVWRRLNWLAANCSDGHHAFAVLAEPLIASARKMAPAFGRDQFHERYEARPGIGKGVRAESSIITSRNDIVGSVPDTLCDLPKAPAIPRRLHHFIWHGG
jgi:hypothetical protein